LDTFSALFDILLSEDNVVLNSEINTIPGNNSKLFLCTTVNDLIVNWLVDTGASVSVIDAKIFSNILKMGHSDEIIRTKRSCTTVIKGATGHAFRTLGEFDLPINVTGRKFKLSAIVVEDLNAGAILGLNFLEQYNATIHTGSQKITLSADKNKSGAAEVSVTLHTKPTIIPPFSSKAIKVLVTPRTSRIVEAIIQGPNIMEGIYKLDAGKTTILYLNDTALPVYLGRGETVGTLIADGALLDLPTVLANRVVPGKIVPKITEDKRQYILQNIKLQVPSVWRPKFIDLILEFHDVISNNSTDLGRTDIISHEVRLKNPQPIHQKQFRIPWDHQACVEEYVDKLLEKKCIQPSLSAFNAPVFCVPKPHGGGLRVVQDFRQLNVASFEDKYIIREVQDCIDQIGLRKSKIFTTLDLTSGFWQQNLEINSRPYTAFTVPGRGRFEWCTTPMGLHGAPASFARLMDHVMTNIPGVITYIDDVLAHSPNLEQHLIDLRLCLERLRRYNLKLNLGKCEFGTDNVAYLGFTLTSEGVKPGTEKLLAVKNFPTPCTETNIREFTGLANYFRHMIPGYALIAGKLTNLLTKDSGWKGGKLPVAAMEAFSKLKEALCTAPVLAYPRGDRPFSLATDAATGDSSRPGGLGAVLTQRGDDGLEHVVSFASRSLRPNEKNYSAFLLEMAAASWAIDNYAVYLRGRKFTLYTDHKPLEKLSSRHQKTLCRLQEQMSEFQFIIKHRAGKDNAGPDALSRNTTNILEVDVENNSIPQCFDISFLKQAQWNDKLCRRLLNIYNGHTDLSQVTPFERAVSADTLISNDGLIRYMVRRPGFTTTPVIIVPEQIRSEIIYVAHESRFGGHAGAFKTTERIRRQYWWPGLAREVARYCEQCSVCKQCNNPAKFQSNHAPMQPLPIPNGPNIRIHMDLFGPLKTTLSGKRYIIVMTDAYSKYAVLATLENKEAATVAKAVFEKWICCYGCPKQIVSDRGAEFVNTTIRILYTAFGIKTTLTSAMHPQTNSTCESFNRTIIKYLQRMMDNGNTLEWECWLPALSLSYNTQVHRTTLTSPFYLMYLREPNLPYFDLEKPVYSNNWSDEALYRLRQTTKLVTENSQRAQDRMKNYAKENENPLNTFQVGDNVLVYFPRSHFSGNSKFERQWTSGWTVIERLGNLTYRLRPTKRRGMPTTVHVDRMKRENMFQKRGGIEVEKSEAAAENKNKNGKPSKLNISKAVKVTNHGRTALNTDTESASSDDDDGNNDDSEGEDAARNEDEDDPIPIVPVQRPAAPATPPPHPISPMRQLARDVFRPHTRSRGPAAEFPRVLTKTLDPSLGRRGKRGGNEDDGAVNSLAIFETERQAIQECLEDTKVNRRPRARHKITWRRQEETAAATALGAEASHLTR
jgi:transposase InsO family protein